MRTSKILIAFCCLVAPSFATSLSATTESASFRMSGVVRTVCRLELPAPAAQASDVIDFGSFYQLCNSRNGYRVTLTHPTNLEGATLFWDGRAVPLSPGNETVIADENQAAMKYSDVRLDVRGVSAPVHSLSFRIDPKGSTF
jgi:hypothetical protein